MALWISKEIQLHNRKGTPFSYAHTICDNCENDVICEETFEWCTPYCPFCGAKMDNYDESLKEQKLWKHEIEYDEKLVKELKKAGII